MTLLRSLDDYSLCPFSDSQGLRISAAVQRQCDEQSHMEVAKPNKKIVVSACNCERLHPQGVELN